MRDYSKVGPKFWIGSTGKRLRAAGMEAQIVAMYLLTSPHANMLGLYYCPAMFIAHETGLGLEGASKGLKRAIEAGFCEYDETSEVVWVIEMASYQVGDSLKPADLRVKGVQNEYASLPDNPYLARFYEKYQEAFCMALCRGKDSPYEDPKKPLRSQEQEQEQEQERAGESPPPVVDNSTPAGTICRDLRALGVEGVNPHNPNLLRLIKAGVTADEFSETAREPKARGKGFAWLLAAVEGRRNDASAKGEVAAKYEAPWFLSASGIQSKGDELGIKQKDGEMFPYFRKRVFEAAGVTDEVIRKAKIDAGEKV